MKELSLASSIQLNNGVDMPALGLGTWQIPDGEPAYQAVRRALESGYRHVDTASIYGNEDSVGRALRDSGLPREQLFVTTKLWNTDQGYDRAIAAFAASRERLGLDYLDLYLIHWPEPATRSESWKALEDLLRQGKVRAIGVSNYTVPHLEELLAEGGTVPAVNQVEFSPYLYQQELLDFCHAHHIQVVAYSPLARGRKFLDPKLKSLSEKYGKTPAQLLIRWALQHGLAVIPKSADPARIRENAEVFDFEITPEDLDRMDEFHEEFRMAWDPSRVP